MLTAEPKKTGVCFAARNAAGSKVSDAVLTSSISSRAFATYPVPVSKRASIAGLSSPSIVSNAWPARSAPAANTRMLPAPMSNTPLKFFPLPIGHVNGTAVIPSARSISSNRSSGSRTSRSILLTNVMIGVPRARQTSSSRSVCASTPLAASITINAASTAVSTR